MVKNFELTLIKRGFTYKKFEKGYYDIHHLHRIQPTIKVQLICSKPVNNLIHGSQNGNEIDAIGYFLFRQLLSDQKPDYHVFSFQHLRNQTSEYMIIAPEILRERLKKNIIRSRSDEFLDLRLWLMDRNLYDTTTMGLEGEWFYLSKGRGGRMIDSTFWNYTKFLNNWDFGFGSRV